MKQSFRIKLVVGGILLLILLVISGALLWPQILRRAMEPTASQLSDGASSVDEAKTVANNLSTPWAIARLPNGDLLVTERSGQLQRIGAKGGVITIEGVRETSEGGLLGLALHPNFSQNQRLYLYSTTDKRGKLTNRVEQYRLEGDRLNDRQQIISAIPASENHDGGAIAFGPDKKLYVTTGDAGNSASAQDRNSLAGKILRVEDDGSIPRDNPFGNAVWSYGHRNPQGIAWDANDVLWSTEHGPSGIQSGEDELNKIEKGGNYGWPVITGDQVQSGMKSPVAQSGKDETWAPAGLVYTNGSLYFTGLRGQSLYQARISSDGAVVQLTRHLSGTYGRLRALTAHGQYLYISTSNRDGRGSPRSGDDRIVSFPLNNLQ